MSLRALEVRIWMAAGRKGDAAGNAWPAGRWRQRNGQFSCQSSRAIVTRENKHRNKSYTGINKPELQE